LRQNNITPVINSLTKSQAHSGGGEAPPCEDAPYAVCKRNIKIVIASTAKQSPYCGECSL